MNQIMTYDFEKEIPATRFVPHFPLNIFNTSPFLRA